MRIPLGLLGIYLLTASIAHAEIEKIATVCNEKGNLCFHWWPKLKAPQGWHQEKEASLENESNIFVPDGYNFSNAVTVIYARAVFKPRAPEIKSLQQMIDNDIQAFREHVPGVEIKEVEPLPIAKGERLRSFTFFPSSKKSAGKTNNWERVTYGEENNSGDEFFLNFTISSRTLEGYKSAEGIYKKLLLSYKK